MAFCAWCGNHVQEVSYAPCPRCGNPTNGAQRVAGAADSSSKTAGLIIGLVVGGLVLIAFLGIIAAIAIPNLLTAKQRASQRRTMADMRTLATALEAYATDNNVYPNASSVDELAPVLSPTYLREVPKVDAWGTALRYESTGNGYAIASAGADKNFEHDSLQEYAAGTTIEKFDNDLVFANGEFVQAPKLGGE